MKISEIAKAAGLTVKSVRYYESVGLIPAPGREENGYRSYCASTLPSLKLIGKARTAGFSVDECRELVDLLHNPSRHSSDVHSIVQQKVAAIDEQLAQLQHIRAHLQELAHSCKNDDHSACAILESLSK